MDERYKELEQRISVLEDTIRSLSIASSIPYEIDSAFRTRLLSSLILKQSTKSINSEDVSIDEAGTATHIVLDDPDYFLEVSLEDGTIVAIPAYTI